MRSLGGKRNNAGKGVQDRFSGLEGAGGEGKKGDGRVSPPGDAGKKEQALPAEGKSGSNSHPAFV